MRSSLLRAVLLAVLSVGGCAPAGAGVSGAESGSGKSETDIAALLAVRDVFVEVQTAGETLSWAHVADALEAESTGAAVTNQGEVGAATLPLQDPSARATTDVAGRVGGALGTAGGPWGVRSPAVIQPAARPLNNVLRFPAPSTHVVWLRGLGRVLDVVLPFSKPKWLWNGIQVGANVALNWDADPVPTPLPPLGNIDIARIEKLKVDWACVRTNRRGPPDQNPERFQAVVNFCSYWDGLLVIEPEVGGQPTFEYVPSKSGAPELLQAMLNMSRLAEVDVEQKFVDTGVCVNGHCAGVINGTSMTWEEMNGAPRQQLVAAMPPGPNTAVASAGTGKAPGFRHFPVADDLDETEKKIVDEIEDFLLKPKEHDKHLEWLRQATVEKDGIQILDIEVKPELQQEMAELHSEKGDRTYWEYRSELGMWVPRGELETQLPAGQHYLSFRQACAAAVAQLPTATTVGTRLSEANLLRPDEWGRVVQPRASLVIHDHREYQQLFVLITLEGETTRVVVRRDWDPEDGTPLVTVPELQASTGADFGRVAQVTPLDRARFAFFSLPPGVVIVVAPWVAHAAPDNGARVRRTFLGEFFSNQRPGGFPDPVRAN